MKTLTLTVGHGLQIGDIVTMPAVQLTRWERFMIWLATPWKWPPRVWDRKYKIVAVLNGTSVEVEE